MSVEVLGVAASIIAIVQISKTVISICQFYIDSIDDAPSDLRVILIEISALKGIAKSLQYLIQPDVATSALLQQLADISGPIEGCRRALKDLEALFPADAGPVNSQKRKRRKLNAALATLAWPLRAGKAKKLLQEIMQHKATINLALTAEFVSDLKDVKEKTEQIQSSLSYIQKEEIHKWLVRTNPSDIHNRSQRLYESGTGSWMLRTPEWPLWLEGKHRCLWIHGIPGAGKSILASFLGEKAKAHCDSQSQNGSKLGYAHYYCYFGHNQDESLPFLRWIISQLCRQADAIPNELYAEFQSGRAPGLTSLLSILYAILDTFERAYVVLDAVDESMPREDLLRVLRDLSQDVRFSKLSLIITSREHIDIEQVLELISMRISMSNKFVEEDIRTLVRSKIQSEFKFQRWPPDLRSEMVDVIPVKAKGMFRWAVCQLDVLKRVKPDAATIKSTLSNLPKTLDETYERVFLAIPEEDWFSIKCAFHWIVYHDVMFEYNIAQAILVEAVRTSTKELQSSCSNDLYDIESLRERCGCLVILEEDEYERPTISFAHYTVEEYLQSSRIQQKQVRFFALDQEEFQIEVAAIAFRQSLRINPHHVAELRNDQCLVPVDDLIDEDFEVYCVNFSVRQIQYWSMLISSNPTLMALCEGFLDPYSSTFKDICACIREPENLTDAYFDDNEMIFWEFTWHQSPDQKSAIFLTLLSTSYGYGGHLARAFVKQHSMLPILTQKLSFNAPYRMHESRDLEDWKFVGTIPEIVAQYTMGFHLEPNLILDLMIECGIHHFDLSLLWLLHISTLGNNNRQPSLEYVENLLRLGAHVDGPSESNITTLQAAVFLRNYDSVKLLLTLGADPNAVGSGSSKWEVGTIMAEFDHLGGKSPLYILRHVKNENLGVQVYPRQDEKWLDNLEKLLLKSGAVEFVMDGLDNGSDHGSPDGGKNDDEC